MFNPSSRMIESFVGYLRQRFEDAFPNAPEVETKLLDHAARSAMEALLDCDCPYHDVTHTIQVVDIGQVMLHGRQLIQGDVTRAEWLHAIIAMLFHDVGYVRGLLRDDDAHSCRVDSEGTRVTPPVGCTDAFMTPFHVSRGCLFVQDHFRNEPLINLDKLTHHIEMTRFPVPRRPYYQRVDDFAALVRSADLLGQMADPLYMKKLSRLFAEFLENGEAARQGFSTVGQLRATFPDFFQSQVKPFVGNGLRYLKRSQDGQQWLANLSRHLHAQDDEPGADSPRDKDDRGPLLFRAS